MNVKADMESRKINSGAEWMLNPTDLQKSLTQLQFTPVIDLFASRINKQFVRYASFRPDPEAEIIDAFTIQWGNLKFYMFPPFSVVPAVLRKIVEDQAMGVCFLPDWSTRVCYSKGRHYGVLARKYQETIPHISYYRWKQFCAERNINWSNATVEQGIDFLANLFEQKLSYSAINTARSALSVMLTPKDGTSFGENRLVCRFLKGEFEIKPALPKYKKIWDVEQVLTYVRSLTLNSELSLKQLSHKLVMLLALLTGQRCQTIHKLMQELPGK
ncbi:Hypothetical predicted protein [Paramuricea clavata]|uniref:Uncharacterized protein n=1 Tax=Paramuricea clavata TaxID=317549 RepID=A0A7D9DPT2_PARCT|nr:Hypothetical predicted protein [Paramuricea clavata]